MLIRQIWRLEWNCLCHSLPYLTKVKPWRIPKLSQESRCGQKKQRWDDARKLAIYHTARLRGGGRGGITQMWVNISAQQTWKRSERAWKEIEEARLCSLTPALRAPQCRPRGALPSRPPSPPPPPGRRAPGPPYRAAPEPSRALWLRRAPCGPRRPRATEGRDRACPIAAARRSGRTVGPLHYVSRHAPRPAAR